MDGWSAHVNLLETLAESVEQTGKEWPYLVGGPHSQRHSTNSGLLWHNFKKTNCQPKPTMSSTLPLLVHGHIFGKLGPTLVTAKHPIRDRSIIRTCPVPCSSALKIFFGIICAPVSSSRTSVKWCERHYDNQSLKEIGMPSFNWIFQELPNPVR